MQVHELGWGTADSCQVLANASTSSAKVFCVLIRDRCQSSWGGASHRCAPPPPRCRTSDLGAPPCHRQRQPQSLVVHPTAASSPPLVGAGRRAGCTRFTQLPGQCGARSEGVRADVVQCLNSRGAGSRQSPGSHVKRIYTVFRRRLPLKVPPAAPAVPPFLHSFWHQASSAETAPSPVGTAATARRASRAHARPVPLEQSSVR